MPPPPFLDRVRPPLLLPLLLLAASTETHGDAAAACPAECICYESTVDCAFRGLRSLPLGPGGIPPDAEWLRLDFNELPAWPGLPDLEPSSSSSSDVGPSSSDVRPSSDVGPSSSAAAADPAADRRRPRRLRRLCLNNNEIAWIARGAFDGTPLLETLSLHANRLGAVPDGAFDGLARLALVRLHDNPWECGRPEAAYLGRWIRLHGERAMDDFYEVRCRARVGVGRLVKDVGVEGADEAEEEEEVVKDVGVEGADEVEEEEVKDVEVEGAEEEEEEAVKEVGGVQRRSDAVNGGAALTAPSQRVASCRALTLAALVAWSAQ